MWIATLFTVILTWVAAVYAGTSIVLVGDVLDVSTSNYLSDAVEGCHLLAHQDPGITCTYVQLDAAVLSSAAVTAAWDSLIQSSNADLYVGLSFMYAASIPTIGPKYPTKSFVVCDSAINPPIPNAIGLTFAEDQSGYLAGAVAGVFTTSKKVGFLGGLAIPPVKRYANGYLSGVLAVCPTCEVYRVYQPSFADAALGQSGAQYLISKGADVIFGAGGSMGSSGILYAAQQNKFVIGVDTDESQSTFANQPTAGQYLLASAMKNAGVAVKAAYEAYRAGSLGNYNMLLDASLNGLGLNSPLVSNAVKSYDTSVQVTLKSSSSLSSSCATASFASRSSVLSSISSSLQRKQTVTQVTADTGDLTQLTRPAAKTWYDMSPWGARSQMLPNTQGHAAVHIGNNQVLVFGGQSPFGAFSKTVMVLDYDGFEWNPVADGGLGTLPAGRMFHAMGYEATGNAVYVFGGQSATGTLGDTWQYSVTTATWAMIAIGANGPTARTNVAHATVGSSMYVYGGVTPVGAVLDDLWALDMVDGTWTDIKPLPSSSTTMTRPPSLQHATLVATNGTKLVLYGGTDAFGTQRNDLYVFSPTDRTWTLQTPSTLGSGPPPPVERMRGISVDWRRVIFTGGLGSNGGALNSTWVWKMDENAWSTNAYGPLPSSLHSHALVGFNQSANPNACAWTIPGLSLCTPATNITLLAISGATGIPGGGVMVSFANQDPLPPPAGAIDPGAKWAVTAINAVGLVGTLALVGFCVVHRGHKVVKASNPRFAVLILLGAALAHVGLISSTWQTDGRRSYMLTAFLVGTGYSLIFSALVVKTYMIYSWSRMSSAMRGRRARFKYSGFIVLTTLLQCLLSALWFMSETNPVVVISVGGTQWIVRSFNGNWVVLCSLPVVFLTLAGVYLSAKTRHLKGAFNESHYIAIATYGIAMALLVVTPVILLLQSPLVQYLISALLTSLTTIGVITVFFGHKVLAVYSPSHIIVTGATAEMTDSFSAYTHSVGATVRCKYCKQVDLNEIMTGGNVSFAATRPGTTPLPPSPRFSRNPLRPPSLGGVGSSSAAAAAAVDEVIVVVGAAVNRIGQPT